MEEHYFTSVADKTEVELYIKGDAKKLYQYGRKNKKPWTVFVDEDADMDEIEEAMDLLSGM